MIAKLGDRLTGFIHKVRLDPKIMKYSIFAAPLSIVLHEMGHAFAAYLVGYTDLYIAYHTWGGNAPTNITSLDRAWMSAGGPIASFFITIICYIALRYKRYPDFSRVLGLLASIQFMGALIYVVSSISGASASTVYDSARVADHLGVSIFIGSIPGSLIITSTWIFFIRSFDKMNRLRALLSIIIGGSFGFLLWLTIIGPILLPD